MISAKLSMKITTVDPNKQTSEITQNTVTANVKSGIQLGDH